MPDTGAPWNIPYVDPTDLVRDYPDASEDLADAIAAGLSAAGGLVAVETVVKTDVETLSLAAATPGAVSGLTIAHSVADAANKVLLLLQFSGSSDTDRPGVTLTAGGTELNRADADGVKNRLTSQQQAGEFALGNIFAMAVHTPGVTTSVTYGVNVYNMSDGTFNAYVNRTRSDGNFTDRGRGASVLTLMEYKV